MSSRTAQPRRTARAGMLWCAAMLIPAAAGAVGRAPASWNPALSAATIFFRSPLPSFETASPLLAGLASHRTVPARIDEMLRTEARVALAAPAAEEGRLRRLVLLNHPLVLPRLDEAARRAAAAEYSRVLASRGADVERIVATVAASWKTDAVWVADDAATTGVAARDRRPLPRPDRLPRAGAVIRETESLPAPSASPRRGWPSALRALFAAKGARRSYFHGTTWGNVLRAALNAAPLDPGTFVAASQGVAESYASRRAAERGSPPVLLEFPAGSVVPWLDDIGGWLDHPRVMRPLRLSDLTPRSKLSLVARVEDAAGRLAPRTAMALRRAFLNALFPGK